MIGTSVKARPTASELLGDLKPASGLADRRGRIWIWLLGRQATTELNRVLI